MARTFNSDLAGDLVQTGELLLHVSDVNDYHNGSVQGSAAVGRQRWGDYSAVTLDPNNDQNFWAIGEYAEAWNNANGCTIGVDYGCTSRTGGSTWGTWISEIKLDSVVAVPEPETYALMFGGLLAVGAMARRRAAAKA
ncbi:MAG: PEP-CTERM sorting domain-containing protein [Bacteriovorax sp.]|nr:PEP-CTERM sorting domain-containing protein [Rhizobacter sp.]